MLFAYTMVGVLKRNLEAPIKGIYSGFTHYSSLLRALKKLPLLSDRVKQDKASLEELSSDALSSILPEQQYQVGFSKNYILGAIGMPDSMSPAHGSVAIRPITSNQPWLLLGRQSPYFRAKDAPSNVTPLSTEIDTERQYNIFGRTPFHITYDPSVIVSGKVLLQAIDETNQAICQSEVNTFVHSNCYTGALYLLSRIYCNAENAGKDSLPGLAGYIRDMADDHLGIGISTSAHLLDQIMKICETFGAPTKENPIRIAGAKNII